MALTYAGYFIESLTDDRGNALKNETFAVEDKDGNAVTLYGDPLRATSAQSSTDNRGNARFWAEADLGPLTLRLNATNVEYEVFVVPDGRDIENSTASNYYEHTQTVPSANWIVNHNLGRYPSVDVLDTTGSVVEAEVRHVSKNSSRVMPTGAMAGIAACN